MHEHEGHAEEATAKDYLIFAGIIAFIFAASWVLAPHLGGLNSANYMRLFMAVFFAVFACFKLLDLPGFVMSYIGYDIIAKKFTGYGYIYPFIELALSLGYFLNFSYTNIATVILMTVGTMGVGRQLLRGSKIKCACLGTYVKLPLTTVSLVEDLAMGTMALVLLLYKF